MASWRARRLAAGAARPPVRRWGRSAPRRPRPRSGYGKPSSEAGPRSGGPSACCARRVPPSHESAAAARARPARPPPRRTPVGRCGCRMRRGPRRVRRVLLAAICFAPGLFNYMLGSRAGAVQARGIDARRTVTRHILTAPRLQQMRPFFATYQLRSNQAACMVGRVDIPTGVYKRQATSPFKPPPSRAVRALRAPPWPPPWPRPWPRPPPPPPLQP